MRTGGGCQIAAPIVLSMRDFLFLFIFSCWKNNVSAFVLEKDWLALPCLV